MVKVVGVKFKTSGRIYYFDPLELLLEDGDSVIVETARGLEFGEVTGSIKEVEESELVAPLKPVVRLATDEDKRLRAQYAAKEGEAFAICLEKIQNHELDMKLVDVEYTFNGSKVVFYFTADERVDFRELVKDLAYALKTRIELRQIGVRDEAKMLGGLGSCGRPVCCKTFLDDFRPVSIKMAKEQNLSLSPTKISGLCGRLMCCLQYEQHAYEDMKKKMPKVGKEVVTVDGTGTVLENNAITEKTKVRLTMEDGTIDIREYPYTHLAAVGEPLPEIARKRPAATEPLDTEFRSEALRTDNRNRRNNGRTQEKKPSEKAEEPKTQKPAEPKPNGQGEQAKKSNRNHHRGKNHRSGKNPTEQKPAEPKPNGQKPTEQKSAEPKPNGQGEQAKKSNRNHHRRRRPAAPKSTEAK